MSPRLLLLGSLAAMLLPVPASAGRFKPDLPTEGDRFSAGTTLRTDAPDEWWQGFGDPALNTLVVEALEANHDIGAAQARFAQAQGVSLQSLSPLLPTASFDVGLNASPSANSAFQVPPQLTALLEEIAALAENIPGQPPGDDDDDAEEDPEVTWNGSALLNLGINIDMGRSAFGFRASQLDIAAAQDDRDAAARIVVQQVVATWLDVRTARARLLVVQKQIDTNANLLELTRRRFEGGQASGLDVLQQQQQLASTRSLLPQSVQLLRLREVQLAVLLGRDPSNPALPDASGLPELPPQPGVGTPRDLLRLRPDLAAANTRYLSAKARVTSSALAFAPTFRLSGNFGWTLRWFNEWASQETWGFGAGVSVPIFSGLQRHGALRQSLAGQDAAARTLSKTMLTAQAEVETALVRETTEASKLAALTEQLDASRIAYEESTRQYAAGMANYLTVLTSLAGYQAAELNQLQAKRDLLGARVDLHTALGSPWARKLDSGASR